MKKIFINQENFFPPDLLFYYNVLYFIQRTEFNLKGKTMGELMTIATEAAIHRIVEREGIEKNMMSKSKFRTIAPTLRIIGMIYRSKRRSPDGRSREVSDIWKYLCKLLTFGLHWWKHYPGEARYIRCRLCSRKPNSQWAVVKKYR